MITRQMLGSGALLGLAAMWLLQARRRQTLRERWGGNAGALIGRGLGSVVGRQLGRHPRWAAGLLRRALLRR